MYPAYVNMPDLEFMIPGRDLPAAPGRQGNRIESLGISPRVAQLKWQRWA